MPRTRKSPTAKSPAKKSPGKSAAKSGGGKGAGPNWREMEGQELGRYLLEHPTISDRLHTDKSRNPGENREAFVRRLYMGES